MGGDASIGTIIVGLLGLIFGGCVQYKKVENKEEICYPPVSFYNQRLQREQYDKRKIK